MSLGEHRSRMKKNLRLTLAVISGYMMIYLAGRVFGTTKAPASVLGWLFENDPERLSYLYGWLLHQNLFWAATAISTVPALFGKKYFSFTSLLGFAAALLLGEFCGQNPAGAATGQGHYGWAIWGGIFAFSVIMGIILEKISRGKLALNSKKLWIWLAVFIVFIPGIVLLVRASMPASFQ